MIFLKKEFYFLCHCLGKSQSLYLGCNPNGTQIGSTPGSQFQGVSEPIPKDTTILLAGPEYKSAL